MAEIVLAAERRDTQGTRPSGRLRREGKIPGVVYGHGIDPLPIAVQARDLRAALRTDAGLNALLALDVAGDKHLALAREVQRDPVRGVVTHVDFVVVSRDEKVEAEVPINFIGEAVEVRRAGGIVEHPANSITVSSTPDKIPSHVDVDISGLTIGEVIRVGDIPLPEGVIAISDADEPVALAATASPVEAPEDEAAAALAAADAGVEGAAVPGAPAPEGGPPSEGQ